MISQLCLATPGNSKPFKFFTHVASHPKFLAVVSGIWHSTDPLTHSRYALKRFHDKLKLLKPELRRLNRDTFGDLPSRFREDYEVPCTKQTNAMLNPHTSTFEEAYDA